MVFKLLLVMVVINREFCFIVFMVLLKEIDEGRLF